MKQRDPQAFPIPCARWRASLAAVHADDLSPAEKAQFEEHLSNCPACAAVSADYRLMDQLTRSLPSVDPPARMPSEIVALLLEWHAPSAPEKITPSLLELPQSIGPLNTRRSSDRSREAVRQTRLLAGFAGVVLVVIVIITGSFALLAPQKVNTTPASTPDKPPPRTIIASAMRIEGKGNTTVIHAFNSTDLSLLWQRVIDERANILNLAASDGRIFVKGHKNLYALDAMNGSTLWHVTMPDENYQAYFSDTAIYIGMRKPGTPEGTISALDVRNGEKLWNAPVTAPSFCDGNTEIESTGICYLELASVASGVVYGYFAGLFAIRADNGQFLWQNEEMRRASLHSVAVSGETIYTISATETGSQLYALSSKSGQIVQTFPDLNAKVPPGYFYQGSNIFAINGTIFFAGNDWNGTTLDGKPTLFAIRDKQLLWELDLDANTADLMGTDGDVLYLKTARHPTKSSYKVEYIAFNTQSRSFAWRASPSPDDPHDINQSITVIDGKLYSVSWHPPPGIEYAYYDFYYSGGFWFLAILHDGKYETYSIDYLVFRSK